MRVAADEVGRDARVRAALGERAGEAAVEAAHDEERRERELAEVAGEEEEALADGGERDDGVDDERPEREREARGASTREPREREETRGAPTATRRRCCSRWTAAAWPSRRMAGNAGQPTAHAAATWPDSWQSEPRNQPMYWSIGVSVRTGARSTPTPRTVHRPPRRGRPTDGTRVGGAGLARRGESGPRALRGGGGPRRTARRRDRRRGPAGRSGDSACPLGDRPEAPRTEA